MDNWVSVLQVCCLLNLMLKGLNASVYEFFQLLMRSDQLVFSRFFFFYQTFGSGCGRKETGCNKESCPHICRPTSYLQERVASAVCECGGGDA